MRCPRILLDALHHGVHAAALGNESVDLRLRDAALEIAVPQAGEEEDLGADAALVTEQHRDVVAEGLGHLHVEQDQVVLGGARALELLEVARGVHQEPGAGERVPGGLEDDRTVVHDQDPLRRNRRGDFAAGGESRQRGEEVADHDGLVEEQIGARAERRPSRVGAAHADGHHGQARQRRVGAHAGDEGGAARAREEVVDDRQIVRALGGGAGVEERVPGALRVADEVDGHRCVLVAEVPLGFVLEHLPDHAVVLDEQDSVGRRRLCSGARWPGRTRMEGGDRALLLVAGEKKPQRHGARRADLGAVVHLDDAGAERDGRKKAREREPERHVAADAVE